MTSPGPGYNYVALKRLYIGTGNSRLLAFTPGQWVPDSTIAAQGWVVGTDVAAQGTPPPTPQVATFVDNGDGTVTFGA